METQEFQGHTPGPWYRMHSNDTIRSEPMGDDAEGYLFDIVGATTTDAELAAAAPDLLIEVKRLQKKLEESKENFALFRDSVVRPVLKHVYSKEEEHKKFQVMIHALRCAQADLQGILPEFEPGGDREHSGWQTLEELNELLAPYDN